MARSRAYAVLAFALALAAPGILLPATARAVPIPSFALAWGSAGSDSSQFLELTGLTVDRSGAVYAADYRNATIQKFTPGGDCLAVWHIGGYPTLTPIGLAAAD